MKKYYAVRCGYAPGIYETWEKCKEQVDGFSGAMYKGFNTLPEAQDYLKASPNPITNTQTAVTNVQTQTADNTCIAYVDGSYNQDTRIYGYGVILLYNHAAKTFSGTGHDAEKAKMRNVSGEIDGAMRAVEEAIKIGAKSITIYYDYMGIEAWPTGAWKCNKCFTAEYANYMKSAGQHISIEYKKVTAHTGVALNEAVDKLAKEAVGIHA